MGGHNPHLCASRIAHQPGTVRVDTFTVLPYVLLACLVLLAVLTVRHINGRRAPILIALLIVALLAGGIVEWRWRAMEGRYTAVSRDLLGRDDTYVVCERLSGALINVWNRSGYVAWTPDGSKPDRADLNWDTCLALRAWERNGHTAEDLDQVIALHVLTHEAMHLDGHYGEAEAECFAVQHDTKVAQLLGATPADAHRLANTYWIDVYPRMRADYVSGECTSGGGLDQTPADDNWP